METEKSGNAAFQKSRFYSITVFSTFLCTETFRPFQLRLWPISEAIQSRYELFNFSHVLNSQESLELTFKTTILSTTTSNQTPKLVLCRRGRLFQPPTSSIKRSTNLFGEKKYAFSTLFDLTKVFNNCLTPHIPRHTF